MTSVPQNPPVTAPPRFALALLLLITAAAYAGVAAAGFHLDDTTLIVANQRLARPEALGALLTEDLWAPGASGYYRPVLLLDFFIDRQLFGLSPAGWHLRSLA